MGGVGHAPLSESAPRPVPSLPRAVWTQTTNQGRRDRQLIGSVYLHLFSFFTVVCKLDLTSIFGAFHWCMYCVCTVGSVPCSECAVYGRETAVIGSVCTSTAHCVFVTAVNTSGASKCQ